MTYLLTQLTLQSGWPHSQQISLGIVCITVWLVSVKSNQAPQFFNRVAINPPSKACLLYNTTVTHSWKFIFWIWLSYSSGSLLESSASILNTGKLSSIETKCITFHKLEIMAVGCRAHVKDPITFRTSVIRREFHCIPVLKCGAIARYASCAYILGHSAIYIVTTTAMANILLLSRGLFWKWHDKLTFSKTRTVETLEHMHAGFNYGWGQLPDSQSSLWLSIGPTWIYKHANV